MLHKLRRQRTSATTINNLRDTGSRRIVSELVTKRRIDCTQQPCPIDAVRASVPPRDGRTIGDG